MQNRTLGRAHRIDLIDIAGHFLPNEPKKRWTLRQKDLPSINNELKEDDGNDRGAIRNKLAEEEDRIR